jgi:putative PEP-CTERM system histidine kinase
VEWTNFISFTAACAATLAAFGVLFRHRGSAAGNLFATGMVLFAAEAILQFITSRQDDFESLRRWQELQYVPFSLIPATWVAFSMAFSRGDYRRHLKHRRKLLVLLVLAPTLTLVATGGQLLRFKIDEAEIFLGTGAQILELFLVGGAILVLKNLEQTFRSSVGTQRWKIKLVVLGIGGLFLVRIYTSCQLIIDGTPNGTLGELNSGMLIIACVLVGISVRRTKDFSIDLYPSHAALQRSVIVVIIGVYLVVIGVLSKLATFLGSETNFQLRALVILIGLVGLALLLMSDRLRERSHAWITRYFQRPHYNYQHVWTSFKRDITGNSSPNELCQSIATWISKTINALSVTVWLVDESKKNLLLAGSTLDPEQKLPETDPEDAANWTVVVQSAIHLEHTVNLCNSGGNPISSLLGLQPQMFPNGGDRFAVPLKTGGGNMGVIIVGDRIDGVPLNSEDEELLATVAEQASLELQSLRMADELMKSREMEAFQNMSTFFVHDLKNTASSLSLMLQNLPKHFDNPDFREDALRSIQKSVDRINEMIQSLSALRRKLVVDPVQVDLSKTVLEMADSLEKARNLRIKKNLGTTGPVNIDIEHMNRVLTNLIVNADEASANGDEIHLRTGTKDSLAFFEVADHGEGMSADFIAKKLFKPFQTTKKSGTGIGLYHSKMIVDAHRGRVEVQSEPGVGTTFRILLPLLHTVDEA